MKRLRSLGGLLAAIVLGGCHSQYSQGSALNSAQPMASVDCTKLISKDTIDLTHESPNAKAIRIDDSGFTVQLMAGKLDVTFDDRHPCQIIGTNYYWTKRTLPLSLYPTAGRIRLVQLRLVGGLPQVVARDASNRTLQSALERVPTGLVIWGLPPDYHVGIGYRMASEDIQSIGSGPKGPYLFFEQHM